MGTGQNSANVQHFPPPTPQRANQEKWHPVVEFPRKAANYCVLGPLLARWVDGRPQSVELQKTFLLGRAFRTQSPADLANVGQRLAGTAARCKTLWNNRLTWPRKFLPRCDTVGNEIRLERKCVEQIDVGSGG